MINPFLIGIVVIALVAGVLIRPSRPPASAEFAAYRSRLRRNLAISLALPIAFTVYGLIASGISASRGERFTHYPRGVYTVMEFVTGYGFVILPLIALVITELGTRAPATRVATLTQRSPITLIPRWILVTAGVAAILAIVTIVLALATSGGLGGAASTIGADVPTGSLLISLVMIIVALALAGWVIRLALVRPDIDPSSASDAWSRSGIAIRATTLATLASIGGFIGALDVFRSAWWDFKNWSEQPGNPGSVHSLTEDISMSYLTDILGLTAIALGVVVAVAFAKPPVVVPAESARVAA